jgi:hypothetical protein
MRTTGRYRISLHPAVFRPDFHASGSNFHLSRFDFQSFDFVFHVSRFDFHLSNPI